MSGHVTTIDWVEDAEKENIIRLQRQQQYQGAGWKLRLMRVYSACQSWLVLATAGAVIGIIAVALNIVTAFLVNLRVGYCKAAFYLPEKLCCLGENEGCAMWSHWSRFGVIQYIVYILLSTLFAAIATFLVLEYAPMAAGSGISEIKCIVSGYLIKGFLGFKTLAIKSLALPFTIASGFSVGKEGPSVHYAACVGNVIGRLFPKYRQHNSKRRELLTACSAAGVAVAFGSPIGGVLFSIEEISSKVDINTIWRTYFCCLVATGTLSMLNPFRNGQMVLFNVRYDTSWHMFELPMYVALGLFGGFMGQFIIKWNLRFQALRKRYFKDFPRLEVIVIAFLTAAVCYWNQYLYVDMTESMSILFHECDHGWEHSSCDPSKKGETSLSLAVAIVIRTAFLLISYGAKVPAGIFVPSLAIGALFGRLLGTLVWAVQQKFSTAAIFSVCPTAGPCINPGAYALLGAGALLSGVMHITMAVVVILFELTGAGDYIVPTMIVVGVTRFVSGTIGEGGIADMAIVANNLPYLVEELELDGVVEDILVDPVTITDGQTVFPMEHSRYPVVDADGNLLGTVNAGDVPEATEEFRIDAQPINTSPVMVAPGTPLEWVHDIFIQMAPAIIYVVDKGKLVGLISKSDMVRSFKSELRGPSEIEHKSASWIAEQVRRIWRF